jgi:hypothetical protein
MSDPAQSHPLHQTKKSIVKAIIAAFSVASILLVTAILPAEYGVDITGVGSVLGLTDMATEDVALAPRSRDEAQTFQKNSVQLRLAPGQGFEYKLRMKEGETLVYSWSASKELEYDFHGQYENDTSGFFESYRATTGNAAHGSLVAPFEGIHGWFWANRTGEPVVITLTIAGFYEIMGVVGGEEARGVTILSSQ